MSAPVLPVSPDLLMLGLGVILIVAAGGYAAFRLWRHSKALAVVCAGAGCIAIAWMTGYRNWLEGIVQVMAVLAALGMAHDGWKLKQAEEQRERKQYRGRMW
ncbi:hypothetical protein [Chitinimonas naiadis]